MGTRTGDYTQTHASDNVREQLTEEDQVFEVGLEHEWSFDVPAGSRVWFHYEAHRTANSDDERFLLYRFTSGEQQQFLGYVTSTSDPNRDSWRTMPLDAVGAQEVRIVDGQSFEYPVSLDSAFIDQIWIRVVP